MSAKPVLVIHGGAGSVSLRPERRAEVERSLGAIIDAVYPQMLHGMSAVDAAVTAAALLEDDPLYNAGKGSKIQSDGKIRMSASMMDGFRRRFGGCVNVEGVKNPIHLARALMDEDDRVLSGAGAKTRARELKLKFASPYTARAREQFALQKKGKSGTIGAIALDLKGHLAAATSTGGRGHEYPFRVSDSPTAAGNFANRAAAVSATGTGEEIVEHAVAATLCAWMESGVSLDKAAKTLITQARRAKAEFGFIALNAKGEFRALTSTPLLIWAAATVDGIHILKNRN